MIKISALIRKIAEVGFILKIATSLIDYDQMEIGCN
jgi:hypothetical protein